MISLEKIENTPVTIKIFLSFLRNFFSVEKDKDEVFDIEKVHFLKIVHHRADIGLASPDKDNTVMNKILTEVKLILNIECNLLIIQSILNSNQCS